MQLYLPLPLRSRAPQPAKDMTWRVYGDGTVRNLLTYNANIGKYVARILADPRTLNQAVIVWEDEVRQADAHALGERISGDGDALKAKRIPVSNTSPWTERRLRDGGRGALADQPRWQTTKDDFLSAVATAKDLFAQDPVANAAARIAGTWNEYQISMYMLEENTLENAKKLGYLDVQELYPDIAPLSLGEYAKQFYAMEEPGVFFGLED